MTPPMVPTTPVSVATDAVVTVTVTPTEVSTYAGFIEAHPAAHRELCEWLRFHLIDPERMPLSPQRIVRDEVGRRVEYDEYVLGADDLQGFYRFARRAGIESAQPEIRRAVSQGEGAPLPWPDAVLELIP